MIVDDDDCIRETVYELLHSENFVVVTANGCDECLQHLKNGFHGLILMDVMMPGKNGWETLREIESRGWLAGNMVIMLTALGAPDDQMDGLQEIVTDYITKPFDPPELIATLRSYITSLQLLQITG